MADDELTREQLLEAVEDLWACLGARELGHLQQTTIRIAQRVHNMVSHGDD